MQRLLTIPYPDSLPDAVALTPAEFEGEARFAMAAKLFEMRRLSSGQAAALAGMNRVDFLLSLGHAGVAAIDYPAEELASELADG